jgi:hypothetical protein
MYREANTRSLEESEQSIYCECLFSVLEVLKPNSYTQAESHIHLRESYENAGVVRSETFMGIIGGLV